MRLNNNRRALNNKLHRKPLQNKHKSNRKIKRKKLRLYKEQGKTSLRTRKTISNGKAQPRSVQKSRNNKNRHLRRHQLKSHNSSNQ